MRGVLAALWLLLALFAAPVAASGPTGSSAPVEFRDAAEEARFRHLAAELRCVMCQNQSLADSDAMIAHDLRREILRMMREGRTDAQVEAFLVERYSEFVLYRPTVEPRNWLLWFGPGLLLLGGAVVVWRIVRGQRSAGGAGTAATPPAQGGNDDGEEW